jgi:hypothetical protein
MISRWIDRDIMNVDLAAKFMMLLAIVRFVVIS